MITLTDGSQIEYHASFSFPRHIHMKFKPEDKETLRRERAAYVENQRQRAKIQELRSQISVQTNGTADNVSPPDNISVSHRSQVKPMLASGQASAVGGRNEQAQNRQNRRIAAVTTRRQVQSSTSTASSTGQSFPSPPPNTAANNECDTNADTSCLRTSLSFTLLIVRLMCMPTILQLHQSRTSRLCPLLPRMTMSRQGTRLFWFSTMHSTTATSSIIHLLIPTKCEPTASPFGTIPLTMPGECRLTLTTHCASLCIRLALTNSSAPAFRRRRSPHRARTFDQPWGVESF